MAETWQKKNNKNIPKQNVFPIITPSLRSVDCLMSTFDGRMDAVKKLMLLSPVNIMAG